MGHYRYRVCPQGYIASGDSYTRRFHEVVTHILLWSHSIEASFHQTTEWLETCGNKGVTLNPDKFVFAADTVEFVGFEITSNDVRPSPRYLPAIRDFPTPQSTTDVKSWFGLVNQVAYAFSMADTMTPFRNLLKPGQAFHWDETLDKLFRESKQKIIDEIHNGVRIFDKSKPTCLVTDWSKTGIGFWLLQKQCQCHTDGTAKPFSFREGWKIVLVGSRFTHPAESRYAPIEGEALAVADALDRARYFVLGCKNLIVAVDHKLLLGIFATRTLDEISNPRLRNLKENTLHYRFRVIHIQGARNRASDCMSRNPTGDPTQAKYPLEDDIDSALHTPEPTDSVALLRNDAPLQCDIDISLEASASASLAGPTVDNLGSRQIRNHKYKPWFA